MRHIVRLVATAPPGEALEEITRREQPPCEYFGDTYSHTTGSLNIHINE